MAIHAIAAPTAGSNAGRGFRYQDYVGALFGVRVWLGEYACVVPEGSDDFEVHGPSGLTIVDSKSKRPGARVRSYAEVLEAFKTLWGRPVRSGAHAIEYWLALEAAPDRTSGAKTALPQLGAPTNPKAKSSFVVVESDPLGAATALLVESKKCTPLAARLVVLAFAKAIGDLASANGERALEDRLSFGPSDAERIANGVLGAIDPDRLEALLRSGYVEPVDFDTRLDEPGFYLGVDVQPGHFASALALNRPRAVAGVLEHLDRARTAVLTGPSGAGKSGLMWNCVIERRDGRHWFLVQGTGAPDGEALASFVKAYADIAPTGFVVDDIGRGRSEVWMHLTALSATRPLMMVIGSARSEDAALLASRDRVREIAVGADADLAKALWEKLRVQQHTSWQGWREPWAQADGLLLEYGHLLSQGERLQATITAQIRRRLAEHRDDELAVLAASALTAAYGGSASIERLSAETGLKEADMARALERLVAEHLVHVDETGAHLRGLHALRAASICAALLGIGYADKAKQARMALRTTDSTSLERVAEQVVADGVLSASEVAETLLTRDAFVERLNELTGALRGVRTGGLRLCARAWLSDPSTKAFAPKFATSLVLMGFLPPEGTPDIGAMRSMARQGRKLTEAAAAQVLPSSLVDALIQRLSQNTDAYDARAALAALAGMPLSAAQLSSLAEAAPNLGGLPIGDVITVLENAHAVGASVAQAWAARAGADALLARLTAETAFALPVARATADDGNVLQSDLYEAALNGNESPNEQLVQHCRALFALDPNADLAHVKLVDARGEKALYLDAEKRMPRSNLPPAAQTGWNRALIEAVAREVGAPSWSAYLERGKTLLQAEHRSLERLLDSAVVGRSNQQALDAVNEAVTESDTLIAPCDGPPAAEGAQASLTGTHLTPLQNVIFDLNARLVLDLHALPKGAPLLASRAFDLAKRVRDAQAEPWPLIEESGEAPAVLDEVLQTLRSIEITALEAAASNLSPRRWSPPSGKPRGSFALIAKSSRKAFAQRIETRRLAIETALVKVLLHPQVLAPTPEDGIIWRTRFAATFRIASLGELKHWIASARTLGDALRAELDEEEDVALVPLIRGGAALDYGYQLSRSNPDSPVGTVLLTAGRASLLGTVGDDIAARLSAPRLEQPKLVTNTLLALRNLLGMLQHGLGLDGRPPAEVRVFADALEHLQEHGEAFLALLHDLDYPYVHSVRALISCFVSDKAVDPADVQSIEGFEDAIADVFWRHVHAD